MKREVEQGKKRAIIFALKKEAHQKTRLVNVTSDRKNVLEPSQLFGEKQNKNQRNTNRKRRN